MTVYCVDDCHVWLGSSSLCTCEAHKVAMMYPFPMGYNPFSPHAPQKAALAPDVPEKAFEAAKVAGASHLSADGQRIYCERFGAILEAEWDGARFGAWWACAELPADAVVLK